MKIILLQIPKITSCKNGKRLYSFFYKLILIIPQPYVYGRRFSVDYEIIFTGAYLKSQKHGISELKDSRVVLYSNILPS